MQTLTWIHGKLHYGHPDLLNVIYISMWGGVSKVQKGLYLNEAIFVGINACSISPVFTFQIQTLLSNEPHTMYIPSGENATETDQNQLCLPGECLMEAL